MKVLCNSVMILSTSLVEVITEVPTCLHQQVWPLWLVLSAVGFQAVLEGSSENALIPALVGALPTVIARHLHRYSLSSSS